MKDRLKLWLRRWTVRTLRKLMDLADDRLHAAEVEFRDEREQTRAVTTEAALGVSLVPIKRTVMHRKPRRRGVTASAFDLRFSSSKP
jgi:hypothetical protein